MFLTRQARRLCALVAALGACSGTPTQDAATTDTSEDVGRDSGHDAGRDAASRDSGADAPDQGTDAGPSDPEWVTLPGFPDACTFEYARRPERYVTIQWAACAASMPGCTYAVISRRDQVVMNVHATHESSGAWLFNIGADGTAADGASVRIRGLANSDGVVRALVRTTDPGPEWNCDGALAGAPTGVAFRAELFGASTPTPRPALVMRGPFADWFDRPLPPGELASIPHPAFMQQLVSSDEVTASQIVPRGYLYFSRDLEPTRRLTPGFASIEAIVASHVFWTSYSDDGTEAVRLYHTGPSDTDDLLIDGVTDRVELRDVDADTHTIAWYRITTRLPDGTIDGGDLMVADFATTAADLHARVLRGGCQHSECLGPRVGADAVAYAYITEAPAYVHTLDVVSLASGARSRITLPSDWGFTGGPSWIDETEVAFPAVSPLGEYTMLRYARTAFTPVP